MKIMGGTHRGRPIRQVPGEGTRPTTGRVRQALFNIFRDIDGARVLDLFAGTGAVSLEALSRGAASAVAVEKAPRACETILQNARSLGLGDRLTLVRGDVGRELERLASRGPFDLIFADPPYAFSGWKAHREALFKLLAPGGSLIIEHGDREGPGFEGGRAYRYGGTTLSVFSAPPGE